MRARGLRHSSGRRRRVTSFPYSSHIAARVEALLAPRLHGGVTTLARISPE